MDTYSQAFLIWGPPTQTTVINNGTINVAGYWASTSYAQNGACSSYTNNGTINLVSDGAGAFWSISPNTTLTNNGTISGKNYSIGFGIQPYPWDGNYSGNNQTVINGDNGIIDIGSNGKAIAIYAPNGFKAGGDVTNQNIGSSILNAGQIKLGESSYGVYLDNANSVQITNTGSINLTGENSIGVYVSPTSSITSLMNTGSIKGSGLNAFGIKNDGVIGSLTNSQGNSSAGSSPLTLRQC
jgi:hypothetical protein